MRTTRPHRSKGEFPPLRWWRIEATAQLPLASSRIRKERKHKGATFATCTTREGNTSFSRRNNAEKRRPLPLSCEDRVLSVDPRVGS